jgi:hypothetical protein
MGSSPQFKRMITDIKRAYHVNQKEIAEEIGITPNHFSKMGTGRSPMGEVYRSLLESAYPKCKDAIAELPYQAQEDAKPKCGASDAPKGNGMLAVSEQLNQVSERIMRLQDRLLDLQQEVIGLQRQRELHLQVIRQQEERLARLEAERRSSGSGE